MFLFMPETSLSVLAEQVEARLWMVGRERAVVRRRRRVSRRGVRVNILMVMAEN